jgi:hypothetical protein
MRTGEVMSGSGEASAMTCGQPPGSWKMISPGSCALAFASRIAWRRLPAPESAVLLTMYVAIVLPLDSSAPMSGFGPRLRAWPIMSFDGRPRMPFAVPALSAGEPGASP